MPYGGHGVCEEHSRPGEAHDSADTFPLVLYLIYILCILTQTCSLSVL